MDAAIWSYALSIAQSAELKEVLRGKYVPRDIRYVLIFNGPDNFWKLIIRAVLSPFLDWYLHTGEVLSPCFLHSSSGMHYAPVSRASLPVIISLTSQQK